MKEKIISALTGIGILFTPIAISFTFAELPHDYLGMPYEQTYIFAVAGFALGVYVAILASRGDDATGKKD